MTAPMPIRPTPAVPAIKRDIAPGKSEGTTAGAIGDIAAAKTRAVPPATTGKLTKNILIISMERVRMT